MIQIALLALLLSGCASPTPTWAPYRQDATPWSAVLPMCKGEAFVARSQVQTTGRPMTDSVVSTGAYHSAFQACMAREGWHRVN